MSSEDRFTVLDGLGNSSPWSAGRFSPVALALMVRQHIKAGSMCVKCSPHGLIGGGGGGASKRGRRRERVASQNFLQGYATSDLMALPKAPSFKGSTTSQ